MTLTICAKSPVLDVWQGVFIIDSLFKVDKTYIFFTIFDKILIRKKIHIYLKNIYIYIYIYIYLYKEMPTLNVCVQIYMNKKTGKIY